VATSLSEALEVEKQRRTLAEFVKAAWHVVEPATEMAWGWHIEAICEHLEAATRGEIRRLVVNIPPRHMKSLLVTVFWPAWVWATFPEKRWLFSSYAEQLSVKHSVVCRRVIQSDWYQRRWGHVFSLTGDQNAKIKFENDHTGFRMATSVKGTATGEGGDFIVVDDPHKVDEVTSELQRQSVLDWWDQTMSTRLNNPSTGCRVIIMQRLHEEDLTGHVLTRGGWTHLCLPAEFEDEHPTPWAADPRQKPGELLWGAHVTQVYLDEKKKDLGSYGFAGQYQQRPAPMEGGILRREWWAYYDEVPQVDELVQSWDLAFKDTKDSDFVVGQVWARNGANKFLLHQIRERLDFPATIERIKDMTSWVEERYPQHSSHRIWIEDAANGPAVIAALRNELPGVIPVKPLGSKEARAHSAAAQIESGNVYLLGKRRPDGQAYDREATPGWVQDFVEECAAFPNAAHDDQVDAMSQALVRLSRSQTAQVRTGGYDPHIFADF
jgi:predicted phage terminase large subunit-like protein